MARDLCRLAEACYPNEAVALVGFLNGEPAGFAPVANRSPEPTETFFVLPHEHYAAERVLRERGWEVGAIFHSHPSGRAEPSAGDRSSAALRDVILMIAGRKRDGAWSLRAFATGFGPQIAGSPCE